MNCTHYGKEHRLLANDESALQVTCQQVVQTLEWADTKGGLSKTLVPTCLEPNWLRIKYPRILKEVPQSLRRWCGHVATPQFWSFPACPSLLLMALLVSVVKIEEIIILCVF